ncbi:YbdK family carboxylate-amine ligase [Cnuibacter sp. UC19_7]|uniref:carboxylate-amine ligase n=1 Tax=Cnuibacter sp. UC19_7 TaxID=3350166 RepID=UPI003672EE39
MELRRFGIEEEVTLVHTDTLRPVPVAATVLAELRRSEALAANVSHELLASQVEYSSPVFETLDEARGHLRAWRQAVADEAARVGALPFHSGTPFDADDPPVITDDPRYRMLAADQGEVIRQHQIQATHVHVGVHSPSDGVRALNGARPWLPVLLALSGGSPFWHGRDTGFESWRTLQMRRWTTNGCPPRFADADDHDARLALLVGVGGTDDIASIAWYLRLSALHPTLEFRVFDAQLDPEVSVLLAALCRALVCTEDAEAAAHPVALDGELIDSSLWHAARSGVSSTLVDPRTGVLAPARAVVEGLLALVDDGLGADRDAVQEGVVRILALGTSAARQRAALAADGVDGLRRLAASDARA